MKVEKILHTGSRITRTIFRLDNGDSVKVSVWFEDRWTQGQIWYNFVIETKKYKHKKYLYRITSDNSLDERYKEYITEEMLYQSYHNHWDKLNPIKMFSKGCINGVNEIKDNITQLEISKIHKAY